MVCSRVHVALPSSSTDTAEPGPTGIASPATPPRMLLLLAGAFVALAVAARASGGPVLAFAFAAAPAACAAPPVPAGPP
eukprot:CAMPEP_0197499516 /NCGR_PEP_ID=MMETSP1311-20131121/61063_1 /TAXON_ID=464262 /ORGANISM="Genus nov. species nov., Strain RCC856" /LENGTH=78 /DNA_ID=CAMNT_0043045261 /DNA_START=441 /DNA_END=678 /DNA_ORIENTATION=+